MGRNQQGSAHILAAHDPSARPFDHFECCSYEPGQQHATRKAPCMAEDLDRVQGHTDPCHGNIAYIVYLLLMQEAPLKEMPSPLPTLYSGFVALQAITNCGCAICISTKMRPWCTVPAGGPAVPLNNQSPHLQLMSQELLTFEIHSST